MKHKAFGKVKVKKRHNNDETLEKLMREKKTVLSMKNLDDKSMEQKLERIDRDVSDTLKIIQRKNIEKELDDMSRLKQSKGNAAAIFDLKKRIFGKK